MADKFLGKRVLCDGFSGKIKYVGPVPPTSGEWYGIEWDEVERGKHNGTHEGVKYFDCRHPCSGSFVRPKKVNFGISVIEALKQRYGQGSAAINMEDMSVVGKGQTKKCFEMVGIDSIHKKQSDFKKLKQVSLRELAVNGPDKDTSFHEVAPDVSELDLSKNLLSTWSDVSSITDNLQHLQVLNVTENLLMLPREPSQLLSSFRTVSVVILNRMRLTWEEVEVISSMIPSIKELHLCHNCIENLRGRHGHQSELRGLQNAEILNLEGNQLAEWTVVSKLGCLPRLKCLILNDNGITNIALGNTVQDGQKCGVLFKSLSSLSLSKNKINDVQSINELNNLPSLRELRFKDNPLFQDESTFASRQELIARVVSLTVLNSSEKNMGATPDFITPDGAIGKLVAKLGVTQKEREEAQRAYLKKYAKSWVNAGGRAGKFGNLQHAFLEQHPRYEALIQVHGIPAEADMNQTTSKTLKDSLITVTITCPDVPDKKSVTKKLPGTMTIGKVKGLLFRLFKVDSADQKLSCLDSKLNREIELDDDLRQLTFYSVQSGDTIYLRW